MEKLAIVLWAAVAAAPVVAACSSSPVEKPPDETDMSRLSASGGNLPDGLREVVERASMIATVRIETCTRDTCRVAIETPLKGNIAVGSEVTVRRCLPQRGCGGQGERSLLFAHAHPDGGYEAHAGAVLWNIPRPEDMEQTVRERILYTGQTAPSREATVRRWLWAGNVSLFIEALREVREHADPARFELDLFRAFESDLLPVRARQEAGRALWAMIWSPDPRHPDRKRLMRLLRGYVHAITDPPVPRDRAGIVFPLLRDLVSLRNHLDGDRCNYDGTCPAVERGFGLRCGRLEKNCEARWFAENHDAIVENWGAWLARLEERWSL